MSREIDLQDLIKIVSDIQNKNKYHKEVVSPASSDKEKLEILVNEIKKIFSSDIYTLPDLLEYLKLFETKYFSSSTEEPITKMQNLFYEEAKLLEKINYTENYFETNYSEHAVLTSMDAYISYRKMSTLELKRYLIWRTKIRNGRFSFPNEKFIYLYLNEIYRGIGFATKEEGFDMLIFLFDNLIRYSIRNFKTFKPYVIEYTIINELDFNECKSFEHFNELIYPFTQKMIDDIWNNKFLENADFLVSNYYFNMSRSRFLINERKQRFTVVIQKLFKEIDLYLNQHHYCLRDAFFIEEKKLEVLSIYRIFYNRIELPTKMQELIYSPFLKIEYNNSYYATYTKRFAFKYDGFFQYLFLKTENIYRKKENYHLLKEKPFPEALAEQGELGKILHSKDVENLINIVIMKEFDYNESMLDTNYFEPVKIDMDKLDNIRKVSNEVSVKLLTEADLEEQIIPEVINEKQVSNNPWIDLYHLLTELERHFLQMIINGNHLNQLNSYCLDNNFLLEVMIEAINEKAVSTIEDVIIDYDGIKIKIFEEYLQEIIKIQNGEAE